jgi:hypothetical protein
VHAPGLGQEDAHVLGHRRPFPQQVREHGDAGLARMHRLRHLRELHRVAEQDERLRARAERERVRERRPFS